jgi:hypothetical protein
VLLCRRRKDKTNYVCDLQKVHARKFISPIFGAGDEAVALIISTNPADLIYRTDLRAAKSAHCSDPGGEVGPI